MNPFTSAIQSQVRLFWLVGDELFLKNQFISQVEKFYHPDSLQEQPLQRFYGDSFSLSQFMNALFDMPLFGGCSIIIVKNLEKLKKNDATGVRKAIGSMPGETVLIFDSEKQTQDELGKLIHKKGMVVDCKPLTDQKAISWVIDYARENHHRIIRRDEAQLMVALIGTMLSQLASELEKLDLYLPLNDSIRREAILKVCNGNRSFGVFDLTDAVLERDLYKAFRILRYLIQEGTPALQIAALINRCVTNAIILYEHDHATHSMPKGAPSPLPAFLLPRYRKFIAPWPSLQSLSSLLVGVLETDIKLKSSGSDGQTRWLEKLIMQIITGPL
ncbi:MAG: DNA polymerase III subunit delta [Candidatus Delongbacteria bacterium]|nr:DNA polymerase III subunit delta [Candidatus Delongbacteria bacterium]